jgi:carbonic anhydrase
MSMHLCSIIFYSLLLISSVIGNEGPLPYPEPHEGWDDGVCKSLQIQSPIDIPPVEDNSVVIDDGSHAEIKDLVYTDINSGEVKFDHGHKWTTEELDVGYLDIYLNETLYKYKLHSFHFHLYSEHRLQNRQYPMELHLVHKNLNKDDHENENLVIGILFDYIDGKENKFLKDINLADETKIKSASILNLINKDDTFYYYKGSLTTVPCTENVNWIVFKDVRSMSYNQFKKFKEWVESSNSTSYGVGYVNARGPKRLSNRKIYIENYYENIPNNKNGECWLSFLPLATLLLYSILLFN